MRLEHYPIKRLKKEIRKIVSRYLDLKKYQIFFFGSRMKKDRFGRADIDVGIEGSRAVPLEIMAKIKDEISQIPTLYQIDVVDFKTVDKDFYKVAKQDIEYL
jgi:predicted nucleotidyltransferase